MMAQWQYNQAGITYKQVGLQYNFLGAISAFKNYYTGGIAAAKRLKRGLGW